MGNDYTLTRPQVIYSDEIEVTIENIKKLIDKHKIQLGRYEKLEAMYYGEMAIHELKKKDSWKPDNRVAVPFAKYIVDTFMGYFIGKPVKVKHLVDEINKNWSSLTI